MFRFNHICKAEKNERGGKKNLEKNTTCYENTTTLMQRTCCKIIYHKQQYCYFDFIKSLSFP
jgi:hypothetical protein